MADETYPHGAARILPAIGRLLLLVLVLPLACALLPGASVPAVLALVMSTLVIEYGAAPVGIGLGLHPLAVLAVLVSVALGVTLFLFDLIGTLGERSGRIKGFLARSAEAGRRSRLLARYGIYGLVPCVMTLGFYVCPPVAGVFGWDRTRSVVVIMAGYTGIAIATILLTLGIADLVVGKV